jgi:hypothetical protein
MFLVRFINPNDPVNQVDFGQMTVNLGITSKTSLTTPHDTPWSLKHPLALLCRSELLPHSPNFT